MILAGVDYSMSCPAMVIGKKGCCFDELKFYSFIKKKKHASIKEQIKLFDYPLYNSEEERFNNLADILINVIKESKVDKVLIEGYSFGSTASGMVFQIAENTGIFKHKLYKEGIAFDVVPPTVVKKSFTGRGNVQKGVMYMEFRDKHCPYEIHHAIGETTIPNNIGNPVSDLIDAYAIWKILND